MVVKRLARQILQHVQAADQMIDPPTPELILNDRQTIEYTIKCLKIDGNIVGALLLIRLDIKETPILNLMTEQSEFALRVLMMRSFIRFQSEIGSLNDLFQQLISGNWRNPDELIARALHKGIQLDQRNYLLAIHLSESDEIVNLLDSRHQQVASQVNSIFDQSVCLIFEELYLISIPVEQCGNEDKLHFALLNLENKLQWIFRDPPTLASSRICYHLDDYSSAWQGCKRLIQLSKQYNRTGILNEKSFAAYAILFASTTQTVVSNFVNQTLQKIDDYDQLHKNKLLDTLSIFLSSNCRYQACADILNIHVTTLRYRIERIDELFDIDFENSDQRFALELALRLRKMTDNN